MNLNDLKYFNLQTKKNEYKHIIIYNLWEIFIDKYSLSLFLLFNYNQK